MPAYKAPLRDIQFAMNEVLGFEQHYRQLPGAEGATRDTVAAVIEEAVKFCEQVISPLNAAGDLQGCQCQSRLYARERLQMRAPVRVLPDKPADPIIAHPDVRRMLLTRNLSLANSVRSGSDNLMTLSAEAFGPG